MDQSRAITANLRASRAWKLRDRWAIEPGRFALLSDGELSQRYVIETTPDSGLAWVPLTPIRQPTAPASSPTHRARPDPTIYRAVLVP